MLRNTIPESEEDITGRESRLKLILLAIALILVAAYTFIATSMGDYVLFQVARMLTSPMLPLVLAAVGGVAVLGGLGYLLKRRLGGKAFRKRAKATDIAIKIPGRQEFIKALESQVDIHTKAQRQFALHLIDIDRFKTVNALLGEAEGDALLKLVGERLMILVDQPERLARIGDDEFGVIQPEAGGARHAEIYAQRIQDAVRDALAHVPQHARPGASIGIAISPDHGDSPNALLHAASLAVDATKKAGGNAFSVFLREMEIAVELRREVERAIGEGLQQGWFELHFQPQYDLGTKRLTGFEALARLHHPQLGDVPPTQFVPIADQSGLIHPLGEWIIHQALGTAGTWPSHMTLSINISLAQFRSGDVAGTILHALSNTGFEAERLRVELSEAVLLEDSDAINEQLRRLRKRGVSIVLDDFGLDTSKLKLLSRSPCDAVKLDRTLVGQVGEVPEMEHLVKSLIGTAHSFHLDILAEGVERAEQARFLMSNDCKKVQGFLFGRPVAASELPTIIAKDARNAMKEAQESGHPSSASTAVA